MSRTDYDNPDFRGFIKPDYPKCEQCGRPARAYSSLCTRCLNAIKRTELDGKIEDAIKQARMIAELYRPLPNTFDIWGGIPGVCEDLSSIVTRCSREWGMLRIEDLTHNRAYYGAGADSTVAIWMATPWAESKQRGFIVRYEYKGTEVEYVALHPSDWLACPERDRWELFIPTMPEPVDLKQVRKRLARLVLEGRVEPDSGAITSRQGWQQWAEHNEVEKDGFTTCYCTLCGKADE